MESHDDQWDAKTNIPTIKLADFGLEGIGSRHITFCGTEGHIAPEIIQAHKVLQELRKQRDKGMKTVPESRALSYGKSVDAWALGKILEEFLPGVLCFSTASLLFCTAYKLRYGYRG